jgi:hypothetical protein
MKSLLTIIVLVASVGRVQAGFITYSDRSTWDSSVGGPILVEDFNGFTVDTEFKSQPLALNGMEVIADVK